MLLLQYYTRCPILTCQGASGPTLGDALPISELLDTSVQDEEAWKPNYLQVSRSAVMIK